VRAEAEYRLAIAGYRSPKDDADAADARNNLAGTIVARGGEAQEAVALARAAIAVRGRRPSYLDTLARACDAVRDGVCARDAYQGLLDAARSAPGTIPEKFLAHARQRLADLPAAVR